MSLINDALKRAREAQQQVPPPTSDLPLRPVEPGQQRARHDLGLLLPAALAVVALFVLFLVWQFAQTRQAAKPIEVTARTAPPPTPASVDAGAAVPAAATQPDLSARPASASSPVSAPAGGLAVKTAANPADSPVADAQTGEATNAAPAAAPAAPKPAPLRLQGILFNPKHPSAMISGKTVFVGDKVGGLRVVAIDQDSATLAGAGQTHVLSLSE